MHVPIHTHMHKQRTRAQHKRENEICSEQLLSGTFEILTGIFRIVNKRVVHVELSVNQMLFLAQCCFDEDLVKKIYSRHTYNVTMACQMSAKIILKHMLCAICIEHSLGFTVLIK